LIIVFCSQIWYWSFRLCWACKTCEIELPKPSVLWPNDDRNARLYLNSTELSGDKFYSYILKHVDNSLKWCFLFVRTYFRIIFHLLPYYCFIENWSAFCHHFDGFVVQFYVPCIQNSICLFTKVFSFVKNQTLSNCRTEVCKALEMPEEECELSMGMSGDFELAVWNSLLKLFSSSNFLDSYVAWLHLQLSQFWMLFSSSGNELTIIIGMGFFDTWCDDDSVWRFLTNNTLTYSLLLNRIQTGPTK